MKRNCALVASFFNRCSTINNAINIASNATRYARRRTEEEAAAVTKGIWDARLGKAKEEYNVRVMEFGACLKDECRKVEAFYVRKLDEYKVRLEILEEAVEMTVDISDKKIDEGGRR